MPRFHQCTR
ncbi:zf-CCHC domain-containing protein, partial [Cephalotus follicularis]